MVEQKGKYFYENEDIQRTHENLETINCFSNIGVEYRSVFPIKIKTRPCIILLRRRTDIILSTNDSPVNVPYINKQSTSSAEKLKTLQLNEIANNNNEIVNSADLEENEYTEYSELFDDNQIEHFGRIDETIENNENTDDTFDMQNIEDDLDAAIDPLENDVNDDEQIIVETELKRLTKETKNKLRKFIERHYRLKASKESQNYQTDTVSSNPNRPSIKSNIRHIIKKEKIKDLIERISQIDLRAVCDLERQTTKQCLLTIIDSYID